MVGPVAKTLGVSDSRVRRDVTIDIPRPPGNVGANQPAVATVSFTDTSKRVAQEGVDAYSQAVLDRLNQSYLGVQRVVQQQVNTAQAQVDRLQNQIQTYSRQAQRATSDQQVALYQSLLFTAQSQLATAQDTLDTAALQLQKGKQIEAPSVVSKSTTPSSTGSAPERLRTMLFGAIIGFLVGVIATFVWKGSPAGRAAKA